MSDQAKELYRQLRVLPWEKLWREEAKKFNEASERERLDQVAVIRAVAVVFAESGAVKDKAVVRDWLRQLLDDPSEKIRRYAANALPKIGAGSREAEALLRRLGKTSSDVEKKSVLGALGKVGGDETLRALEGLEEGVPPGIEQKLKAGAARRSDPSAIRTDGILREFSGWQIVLRGRAGLESFVRAEVEDALARPSKFRVKAVARGLVTVEAIGPFSLADIYRWRCFGTVGFGIGAIPNHRETEALRALAQMITSPKSRQVLECFTIGTIRYRLNFVGKGHQRAAVRELAEGIYELCPTILNDARNVTWTVDILQNDREARVELRPNMTPDPRFSYRRGDVPAASHPPLAACLARLAGQSKDAVVWDPFCGSGTEAIECAVGGAAKQIIGTDLSKDAVAVARKNFDAAARGGTTAQFICGDFRECATQTPLGANSVTAIVTNPPMGLRVPVANRRSLINDLFAVAVRTLRVGGRLVLVNPLPASPPPRQLERRIAQDVDMGGFTCRIEQYNRIA